METMKEIVRGDVKFYPSIFPFNDGILEGVADGTNVEGTDEKEKESTEEPVHQDFKFDSAEESLKVSNTTANTSCLDEW